MIQSMLYIKLQHCFLCVRLVMFMAHKHSMIQNLLLFVNGVFLSQILQNVLDDYRKSVSASSNQRCPILLFSNIIMVESCVQTCIVAIVYQENRRPPICGNSPLNPSIFILLAVAKVFVATMLYL